MSAFASHVPAPPLREFVHDIWQCAFQPADSGSIERIVPSGTVELVINLRHDDVRITGSDDLATPRRYEGAVVSGTYAAPFFIDPRRHTSMLGVHFRPGGASQVLGIPAGELAGKHVELDTLWGRVASELRERVCAARTAAERFTIVEQALMERLARPRCHRTCDAAAVHSAIQSFGPFGTGSRVGDVAALIGMSHRRFIEVFRATVGLTPKTYCKILRFQRAVSLAQSRATPDWAGIAFDCGYFDQSHLIRDFVDFAGLRPSEFLRASDGRSLRHHIPA